jgi:type VI secretion system protein ImpJ
MSPQKLAYQRWVQGQILEPEHFRAGEEATAALACLVGELRGLPFHGVARLAWSEAALAKGCLSISALTVVLADGTLLDVPGNAAVSDLDLTKLEARKATVYLHLLLEPEAMPRTGAYEGDPSVLKRSRFKLRLSLDKALDGARLVFPLVTIVCEKLGGPFRRSPDFAPPLISAFGHPFLREKLDALREILFELRTSFADQFSDPLFRGERLASARFCEAAAVRIEIMIAESEHGIMPHPHALFDAMRALWIDLLALHEQAIGDAPLYDHEHPAACFGDLVERLRALAGGEPVRSPNLGFSREADDHPFVARTFSKALARATEVYFVVERTPDRVPLGAIKLASPGRIDLVIRQSLPGVTVELVPVPPFRHAFGPMVDFYRLDTSTDEWKRAVDARALAYRASTALAKARTTLYWRSLEASQAA